MTQKPFLPRGALAAVTMALCLGWACTPVMAATTKAKKTSTVKKQGTTKFLPGSQETRRERTERLKRECKGRVDAGACEGYTR